MGSSVRSWFPLAALAFALLVMVAAELVPAAGPQGYPLIQGLHGLGTGGVGGTGHPESQLSGVAYATAVSADAVPSARLGWLAGLACVVLAVAGWYWRELRRAATPPRPGRFVLGTLGALAAVPLLDLVGLLQFRLGGDVRGALIAALGLLLLAGYERSWFLLAVAGVFALVATVFLPPVAGALAAAGVLFAAAFAVLLRPRPDGPDAA
ncbi:hypothetical protein [Amycolatopsis sp. DG1A-15b]|uniref:hypothetical protein n=1 Tax=Amycolatopsis sp. DG1A-15b TaxID=3052846 RepID=UPI00255BCE71|nr:hypothetical protein [Amycolatopsis sp. DG1A-15b]WIX89719.1 hypothetical protein QRY02_04515 [Amycolatopsis sp. DG1A-15b]